MMMYPVFQTGTLLRMKKMLFIITLEKEAENSTVLGKPRLILTLLLTHSSASPPPDSHPEMTIWGLYLILIITVRKHKKYLTL